MFGRHASLLVLLLLLLVAPRPAVAQPDGEVDLACAEVERFLSTNTSLWSTRLAAHLDGLLSPNETCRAALARADPSPSRLRERLERLGTGDSDHIVRCALRPAWLTPEQLAGGLPSRHAPFTRARCLGALLADSRPAARAIADEFLADIDLATPGVVEAMVGQVDPPRLDALLHRANAERLYGRDRLHAALCAGTGATPSPACAELGPRQEAGWRAVDPCAALSAVLVDHDPHGQRLCFIRQARGEIEKALTPACRAALLGGVATGGSAAVQLRQRAREPEISSCAVDPGGAAQRALCDIAPRWAVGEMIRGAQNGNLDAAAVASCLVALGELDEPPAAAAVDRLLDEYFLGKRDLHVGGCHDTVLPEHVWWQGPRQHSDHQRLFDEIVAHATPRTRVHLAHLLTTLDGRRGAFRDKLYRATCGTAPEPAVAAVCSSLPPDRERTWICEASVAAQAELKTLRGAKRRQATVTGLVVTALSLGLGGLDVGLAFATQSDSGVGSAVPGAIALAASSLVIASAIYVYALLKAKDSRRVWVGLLTYPIVAALSIGVGALGALAPPGPSRLVTAAVGSGAFALTVSVLGWALAFD